MKKSLRQEAEVVTQRLTRWEPQSDLPLLASALACSLRALGVLLHSTDDSSVTLRCFRDKALSNFVALHIVDSITEVIRAYTKIDLRDLVRLFTVVVLLVSDEAKPVS